MVRLMIDEDIFILYLRLIELSIPRGWGHYELPPLSEEEKLEMEYNLQMRNYNNLRKLYYLKKCDDYE